MISGSMAIHQGSRSSTPMQNANYKCYTIHCKSQITHLFVVANPLLNCFFSKPLVYMFLMEHNRPDFIDIS